MIEYVRIIFSLQNWYLYVTELLEADFSIYHSIHNVKVVYEVVCYTVYPLAHHTHMCLRVCIWLNDFSTFIIISNDMCDILFEKKCK